MTQKEAFELIKQTIKDCKGSLDGIFINVQVSMYLYLLGGSEETELWISVKDEGLKVCQCNSIEEAVSNIKNYYSVPQTTVTADGELPKLAS